LIKIGMLGHALLLADRQEEVGFRIFQNAPNKI